MSLLAVLVASFVCGTMGILMGMRFGRRRSTNANRSSTGQPPIDEKQKDKYKIESMMDLLHDLTCDVGSQVGEHAARVSEFSDSLSSANSVSCDPLITAGETLVASNAELQVALAAATAELESQRQELRQLIKEARTDALTGLPNRRAFDQELNRLIALHRRRGTPFSLIMLDIDRFKNLNDEHGHMIGDQVLKAFGRCLQTTFRDMDLVARYGGEEFAAILPQTTLGEALLAAERTRIAIAGSRCAGPNVELSVTASLGVKEIAAGETITDLIKQADQALYAAKKGGRNCCFFHDGTAMQRYVPKPTEQPDDEACEQGVKPTSDADAVTPKSVDDLALSNG